METSESLFPGPFDVFHKVAMRIRLDLHILQVAPARDGALGPRRVADPEELIHAPRDFGVRTPLRGLQEGNHDLPHPPELAARLLPLFDLFMAERADPPADLRGLLLRRAGGLRVGIASRERAGQDRKSVV